MVLALVELSLEVFLLICLFVCFIIFDIFAVLSTVDQSTPLELCFLSKVHREENLISLKYSLLLISAYFFLSPLAPFFCSSSNIDFPQLISGCLLGFIYFL